MEVPVGFLAKLWSFLTFLPFFFLLFLLGLLKAVIIGPVVVAIIVIGNAAVLIGLCPAHFLWTLYCVARTRRLGLLLKMVALLALPLPLILCPILGIIGSVLGGIGYGFFTPLISTFEAVGHGITNKCYHCFVDGCFSTIKGSCTVMQDVIDFCFFSYFSYMDELSENMPDGEKPMDIQLSRLPGCFLVSMIGMLVDVPLITAVALWKSPYMLYIGWKRLLEDLIGREGPFLETVCVPFAGLAILLWPLAVVGAVLGAILVSFLLGIYAGVVVHQENSVRMGFSYVVAVVSLFDEYVNDLLYLREGSCLPRCIFGPLLALLKPRYRRKMAAGIDMKRLNYDTNSEVINKRETSSITRLVSQQSRNLRWAVQQYKPIQVWDWFFKSCEVNGRILLRDGLIKIKDIEECLTKGNSSKLSIKLPTWSILQCLLTSAKSESPGLVITDDVELARYNAPKDKVTDWLIGPLFVMKEQLKKLQLTTEEELCLQELVMSFENKNPEDWDNSRFPSGDRVRRAQLQAVIRRLQGIVASMSRIPTFRRRFRNLVRVLYLESLQAGASGNHVGGILTVSKEAKSMDGNLKGISMTDSSDIV